MAQYPIKMLKDENGTPFVPLVAPEAVKDNQGTDWQTLIDRKLEKTNIIAGQNVTITTDGNDITINSAAGGASANVIDNLDQTTGGVGVLDARQGHVLKGMIPDVVNNLTTVDTTKALSAYQGYLLNHKVVPTGGAAGQVLKKKSATDNDLEWGDAADPNAISGDSSIKKIVALTYEEYEQLVADGEVEQDTEYHIIDAPDTISGLQHEIDDLQASLNTLSEQMALALNNFNYSTSKTVIGHWVDGRPIYRKYLSGNDYSSLNGYDVGNLDLLINYYGSVWYNGTYQFPIGKSIPPSKNDIANGIGQATRIIVNPSKTLQVLSDDSRLDNGAYWLVIEYVEVAS